MIVEMHVSVQLLFSELSYVIIWEYFKPDIGDFKSWSLPILFSYDTMTNQDVQSEEEQLNFSLSSLKICIV